MNPLRVFLLPPHYCGLGAGSIPFRTIVNKKQCETRDYLFVAGHSLLNRRDVQDSQGVSIPQNVTFLNNLTDINLLTKITFKARYSYCAVKVPLRAVLPLQWAQLTKTVHTARLNCFC